MTYIYISCVINITFILLNFNILLLANQEATALVGYHHWDLVGMGTFEDGSPPIPGSVFQCPVEECRSYVRWLPVPLQKQRGTSQAASFSDLPHSVRGSWPVLRFLLHHHVGQFPDHWLYFRRWGSFDELSLPELALTLPPSQLCRGLPVVFLVNLGTPVSRIPEAPPGRAQPGSRGTALRMPSARSRQACAAFTLDSPLGWPRFNRFFS